LTTLISYLVQQKAPIAIVFSLECTNTFTLTIQKTMSVKVILYSYLILKKMNERITDS